MCPSHCHPRPATEEARKPVVPDRNPLNQVSLPTTNVTPPPSSSPAIPSSGEPGSAGAGQSAAPGGAAGGPRDPAQFEEMKSRKMVRPARPTFDATKSAG